MLLGDELDLIASIRIGCVTSTRSSRRVFPQHLSNATTKSRHGGTDFELQMPVLWDGGRNRPVSRSAHSFSSPAKGISNINKLLPQGKTLLSHAVFWACRHGLRSTRTDKDTRDFQAQRHMVPASASRDGPSTIRLSPSCITHVDTHALKH